MPLQIYGFLIDQCIYIDIKKGCIFRLESENSSSTSPLGFLYLNDTMMSLFSYLLIHARARFVTKEEVLKNVWDENNLSSSGTRLWQVFTSLKHKLALLNLPDGLIRYEKRKGFFIEHQNILTIYYKESDLNFLPGITALKPRRSSVFVPIQL